MAKKSDINQAAEIRALVQELGRDAKFKDVFERLRAKHKGHTFNENSCNQAFSLARAKLGFIRGRKVRRKVRRKSEGAGAGMHAVAQRSTAGGALRGGVRGGAKLGGGQEIIDVIRAAKMLIGLTGSPMAAKEVIDTL